MTDTKRLEEKIRKEFELETTDGFKWIASKYGEFDLSFLDCLLTLPSEDAPNLTVHLDDDEGNLISITYRNAKEVDEDWMVSKIREVYEKYDKLRTENYWFSLCMVTGDEE